MRGFLHRWASLNAPFLAKALRALAGQLDHLFPGSPSWAAPLMFTTPEGVHKMASIEVVDTSEPLTATVAFLDAEGHETTADDVPQWASDNEDAATVTAAEDGLSAEVAVGGPGAAIISVSSTNDDGSVVTAQGTITVMPGDAVIGDVSFTPPA